MKRSRTEEVIYAKLLKLAEKAGARGKLPTVRALCKSLSTSPSTLDRVLRRLEFERILNRVQGSGLYVSPLYKQRRIGVVFGWNLSDPTRFSRFWFLLYMATARLTGVKGDEMRTYFGFSMEEKTGIEPAAYALSDDIRSGTLSGFLTFGIGDEERLNWLKAARLPIVSFSNPRDQDGVVDLDNLEIMKLGLAALRKQGCKNVALVWHSGSSRKIDPADPVVKGFRESCAALGLDSSDRWLWGHSWLLADNSWRSIEEASSMLVQQEMRRTVPDGIMFLDDTMAHGGLITLLEAGLLQKGNLKVAAVTHSGNTLLQPFHRYLTRVQIDPAEIAERMSNMLEDLLKGRPLKEKLHFVSAKVFEAGSPEPGIPAA